MNDGNNDECLVRSQFIADQNFYFLELDAREAQNKLEYLRREKLPDRGDRADDNSSDQLNGSRHEDRWLAVENRFQFLTHANLKRLAVTVSAGIGKSLALKQVVVARQQANKGQVVVHLHFSRLPSDPDGYLHSYSVKRRSAKTNRTWEETRAPVLLAYFHDRFKAIGKKHCQQRLPSSEPEIRNWIESLIRLGQLTLVVDGLDEVGKRRGKKLANSLRRFLSWNSQLACVVAGRPYSITDDYWNELFAKDEEAKQTDPRSDWDFCLVGTFRPQQIKRFIGADRFQQIQMLQADVEFTPRILEVVRTLPIEILDSMRSIADLYWHAFVRSLELDRDKPGLKPVTSLSTDEIIDIFSALAITMVMWNHDPMGPSDISIPNYDRQPQLSPVRFLDGTSYGTLINRTLGRLKRIYHDWVEKEARGKLNELLRLGFSHIELDYVHGRERQAAIWRNPTERDFFAALWMVRSSNGVEQRWLLERQTSIVYGGESLDRVPEMKELWSFVCGMPGDAFLDRDLGCDADGRVWKAGDRWFEIVQQLYRRPNHSRSTEMMYRSWPNLLRRAKFLNTDRWSEDQLRASTISAQFYVQQQHNIRSHQHANNFARQIVVEYLSEYLEFRAGEDQSSRICREDGEQMVAIPYPDGGRFFCGHRDQEDNPEVWKKLSRSFSMNRFQVTRRLYRLFDACHETRSRVNGLYSPYERGPATNISWYDATMCSYWLHGYLPTEWEWEHSSRVDVLNPDGSQSRYYFRDDDLPDEASRENRLVEYAWIKTNSGEFDESASERDRSRAFEVHLHIVGQKLPTEIGGKAGLYDMLGNVWEWTCSLYEPGDSLSRSLRGGSVYSNAFSTDCSYRYYNGPSDASGGYGFRISRAIFQTS